MNETQNLNIDRLFRIVLSGVSSSTGRETFFFLQANRLHRLEKHLAV